MGQETGDRRQGDQSKGGSFDDWKKSRVTETRVIIRYEGGSYSRQEDSVVAEAPLTIMLNEQELATIVCSPYAQKELVIGFLAGEGLIRDLSDLKGYFHREKQEVVWVETDLPVQEQQENMLRRNFASCCGKGRPTLYFRNDAGQIAPLTGGVKFTPQQILNLIRQLEEDSDNFRLTGGVHSAGLAGPEGIMARYEDIGRHNALDRILGHVILKSVPTSDKAVLLSGRISSEMLIKAARIGTPVVVSRSAPTGLAIDLAEDLNITVVGFARGDRMNIYCHQERIVV
ncbi:MAG: formate dehydrogenase accessory sulfurtransferase FdhD [Thermovirgaceae bacterium]|nr:formate dehydrogenase accessory sulfurtransferase FdhD [Thermovirgaceae bacterium]